MCMTIFCKPPLKYTSNLSVSTPGRLQTTITCSLDHYNGILTGVPISPPAHIRTFHLQ